jgi:hypothetical protein
MGEHPRSLQMGSYTVTPSSSWISTIIIPIHKTSLRHVGFEVLTVVAMKSSIFLHITQCSPLKVDRRFGLTCSKLAASFMMVSSLAYSSIVEMEGTCSSETSADFQRTTKCYTPEDRTLQAESVKLPVMGRTGGVSFPVGRASFSSP